MAKVSLFLDARKKTPSVKLLVNVGSRNALISLGILLESENQWRPLDPKGPIVNHPNAKAYSMLANQRLQIATDTMVRMELSRGDDFTLEDLKEAILERIKPAETRQRRLDEDPNTFRNWYNKFMRTKEGRTREIYQTTLKRLDEFCVFKASGVDPHDDYAVHRKPSSLTKGSDYADRLRFEDIDDEWIADWENYMKKTMPTANARSIHLRNLRAVCKYAIKWDATTHDPFKRVSIKREETRHRALTPEQFRRLFTYPIPEAEKELREYRDIALLIFLLIGINVADLYYLEGEEDGRVVYDRRKTHKAYSIKVEPEAQAIINRYKGERHLLRYADTNESHISLTKKLNTTLKHIGPVTYVTNEKNYGRGQKIKAFQGLFSDISVYWMRHTWATFAYCIGVHRDDIARCLGHGRKTVTDIYIDYDQDVIDETNRKVIDYAMSLLK